MIELIITKDRAEKRRALEAALKALDAPITTLTPETFSINAFAQEVETLPFLSKSKTLIIKEIDSIKPEGQEAILHYLARPNGWVSLVMTATTLHPQSKLVKAVGNCGEIRRFREEKGWEQQRRLSEWVVEKGAQLGVRISSGIAQKIVQKVDKQSLEKELEKLACFVGEGEEVTAEAVDQIVTPAHHETLWQLGEAVFERQVGRALSIGEALIGEGLSLFPLLAHLRTQIKTAQKTLSLFREGGKGAVTAAFPYLKGGLLEKKVRLYEGYGLNRLVQAQLSIYETEIEARTTPTSPKLLLELLLVRLSHDSLSPSECIGSR